MRCPFCEKEIRGTACPECGAQIPEESKYCMECGAFLEREQAEASEEEEGLDLEDRVLCPDGTCTGIIVNGECTECGKVISEKDNEKT